MICSNVGAYRIIRRVWQVAFLDHVSLLPSMSSLFSTFSKFVLYIRRTAFHSRFPVVNFEKRDLQINRYVHIQYVPLHAFKIRTVAFLHGNRFTVFNAKYQESSLSMRFIKFYTNPCVRSRFYYYSDFYYDLAFYT